MVRTERDLVEVARDRAFPGQDGPWPVYVSRRESLQTVRSHLSAALPQDEFANISLRLLPRPPTPVGKHGLLYLPRPYLASGPRFNEMNGWSSYFLIRGLLEAGEIARARDLVDDAVYEVMNFGKVLDVNRTYDLGRSQPPLLSQMILEVYSKAPDRAWLASTLPAIRIQYQYWTTAPHLAGNTGLSRYHALGSGPAPDVRALTRDAAGRDYYQRMKAELESAPPDPDVDLAPFYDRRRHRLTALAYVADRSLRESGFHQTERFGSHSLGILDYAPVCLNSLLLAMERDMARILTAVGGELEAQDWWRLAEIRQQRLNSLLWDEDHGMFMDYDVVHQKRRFYPFATTLFPLWVGAVTPARARQVAEHALALLEEPGGLVTSNRVTGYQWDAPYGLAPLQLVAVEALRAYGLIADADRIARAFLDTVLKEYVAHGRVFDKYDVVHREGDSAVSESNRGANALGAGWTNAVVLLLEAGLGTGARHPAAAGAPHDSRRSGSANRSPTPSDRHLPDPTM